MQSFNIIIDNEHLKDKKSIIPLLFEDEEFFLVPDSPTAIVDILVRCGESERLSYLFGFGNQALLLGVKMLEVYSNETWNEPAFTTIFMCLLAQANIPICGQDCDLKDHECDYLKTIEIDVDKTVVTLTSGKMFELKMVVDFAE